jgi:hypothetical protein
VQWCLRASIHSQRARAHPALFFFGGVAGQAGEQARWRQVARGETVCGRTMDQPMGTGYPQDDLACCVPLHARLFFSPAVSESRRLSAFGELMLVLSLQRGIPSRRHAANE